MGEPSWCALTSTPSMAPSCAEVTRPARAMGVVCAAAVPSGSPIDSNRRAIKRIVFTSTRMGTDSPRTQRCSLPPCGGGLGRGVAASRELAISRIFSTTPDRFFSTSTFVASDVRHQGLLLHHQTVDFDWRIGVVRQLAPGGALQLEAL